MYLPSREASGAKPPWWVTWIAVPPGDGIFQISQLPVRLEPKYSHLPSADQSATPLSASPVVTWRGWPPSALTTKILLCPAGRESKTISRPSGDQRGVPVSGPPKCVSCTRLVPSASQRQI